MEREVSPALVPHVPHDVIAGSASDAGSVIPVIRARIEAELGSEGSFAGRDAFPVAAVSGA